MKKILGVIALLLIVVIPLKVNAATVKTELKCDKTVKNGDVNSIPCHIYLTSDASVSTITGTLTLTNVTLTAAGVTTTATGWDTTGSTGDDIVLSYTGSATSFTDTKIADFTVTKVKNEDPCNIRFVPSTGVTCTDCDYDDENPKTGSAIPYIVIGSLAVLAGVVYIATRKNTKLYKI